MAKSFSLPSLPFNSPHSITSHLPKISCSSTSIQSQSAKRELLTLISDQERGLKTQRNPQKLALIVKSVDALASLARNSVTTDDSLSATWRLLWTTEKEQLFIVEKAHLFGTQAGDVLQVIDVEKRSLNNVITFPPDGVFFVRSTIEIASSQRVDFRFESVYLDDEIRVVKDIRGDYLIVERAPYTWKE
ncbi:probable plastid-lipid-associated protein 11 isoform X2 [Momordica charantia]|uniref:Probable plastid-lipid-associated protein 11 isoform X2 n=1 Tax=Momordica charantia TaxID=3673 RepID=A0A6J1DZP0_MOMCH|nr:probable plastid-lipid-associated protein 11 isoform X2 [Momordica charantia]